MKEKKIQVALNGSEGRMGTNLTNMLKAHTEMEVAFGLTKGTKTSKREEAYKNSDIVIDFSTPNGTLAMLNTIKSFPKCAMLIGTTGLEQKHQEMITELSKTHAILYAPNTSLTAHIVAELSAKASRFLREFDVEIVELHHRSKKDAPSGTSLMIGQEIASAREIDFQQKAIYSRKGEAQRQNDEIGFCSVRGGGIYGDNKVVLAGDNEVLSIECRALNRRAFASGAIKAAMWLIEQKPGLYSMKDFLNNA